MHRCQDYRDGLLEGALEGVLDSSEALPACTPCLAWRTQTLAHVSALRSLPTLALPENHASSSTLGSSFGSEQDGQRVDLEDVVERFLVSLPSRPVPDELAERVSAILGAPESDGQPNASLGDLESQTPPSVLRRLVEEEMAAPLAFQSARIMGRLDRLRAPSELAVLVAKGLSRVAPGTSGVRWSGWVGFLAACLVGWMAMRSGVEKDPAPKRRFTIVHADSLAELSPLARTHMEALGGASSNSEQEKH